MTEATKRRRFGFDLRTLLAAVTGCAFAAFVAQWFVSQTGGVRATIMVLPWAIGAFVGIFLALGFNRSALLWGTCGGLLGCLLCPGMLVLFLYLNRMNGVTSLSSLWIQLSLAACGGWTLAAIVVATRAGLSVSHK